MRLLKIYKNSFETRLTYHQGGAIFFVVILVVATCHIEYALWCVLCTVYEWRQKTHTHTNIQSNIIQIQTYSRIQTYVLCHQNNRQKLVFVTPYHLLKTMTISQTIDWIFFCSSRCWFCWFHAHAWMNVYEIVFCALFYETLCIENGISIGNHKYCRGIFMAMLLSKYTITATVDDAAAAIIQLLNSLKTFPPNRMLIAILLCTSVLFRFVLPHPQNKFHKWILNPQFVLFHSDNNIAFWNKCARKKHYVNALWLPHQQ